jgi:hypothetical protein
MASSGIRLGAWDYIQWKHVEPIKRDGKIVAVAIYFLPDSQSNLFHFVYFIVNFL